MNFTSSSPSTPTLRTKSGLTNSNSLSAAHGFPSPPSSHLHHHHVRSLSMTGSAGSGLPQGMVGGGNSTTATITSSSYVPAALSSATSSSASGMSGNAQSNHEKGNNSSNSNNSSNNSLNNSNNNCWLSLTTLPRTTLLFYTLMGLVVMAISLFLLSPVPTVSEMIAAEAHGNNKINHDGVGTSTQLSSASSSSSSWSSHYASAATSAQDELPEELQLAVAPAASSSSSSNSELARRRGSRRRWQHASASSSSSTNSKQPPTFDSYCTKPQYPRMECSAFETARGVNNNNNDKKLTNSNQNSRSSVSSIMEKYYALYQEDPNHNPTVDESTERMKRRLEALTAESQPDAIQNRSRGSTFSARALNDNSNSSSKNEIMMTQSLVDYCSTNPDKSCYSPKCYLPALKYSFVSSEKTGNSNNKHNNDNNYLYKSNRTIVTFDYSKLGRGCVPNPYYVPPKVDKKKNYGSAATKKWSGGYPNQEFTCVGELERKNEREEYFGSSDDNENNNNKNSNSSTNHKKNNDDNRDEPQLLQQQQRRRQDPLFKFKKHTSWLYSKYYDWSGKCHRPATPTKKTRIDGSENGDQRTEDYVLRGSHSQKDGLYRFQNVCLRPRGGFGGFVPPRRPGEKYRSSPWSSSHPFPDDFVKPYRGTNDVFQVAEDLSEVMAEWISTNPRVTRFRLDKPADCYLDTKLVLFPISFRIENPGHVFYRAGSMLRVLQTAFGDDAMYQKDNVTVGYVVVDTGEISAETKKEIMTSNFLHYFYDILGTSWFSTYGVDVVGFTDNKNNKLSTAEKQRRKAEELRRIYGFLPSDSDLNDTVVCFKEAVVWQNAHNPERSKIYGAYGMLKKDAPTRVEREEDIGDTAKENSPGRHTSFHIHGARSEQDKKTLAILDSRLRACGNLPPRRKRARRRNPHIMFAIRSKWRRFSLQPYLVDYFATHIPRMFGAGSTFEVVEHSAYTFPEVMERFSDADVLIGYYGAALTWAVFMPPNAIVVEFNTRALSYAPISGINLHRKSEFGGGAVAAGMFHLAVADFANNFARYAVMRTFPMRIDRVTPFEQVQAVLDTVSCLFVQTAATTAAVIGDENSNSNNNNNNGNNNKNRVLAANNNNNNNNKNYSASVSISHQRELPCPPVPSCCDRILNRHLDDGIASNLFSFVRSSSIASSLSRSSSSTDFSKTATSPWIHGLQPMLLNTRLYPRSSPFFSPRLEMLVKNVNNAAERFAIGAKHFIYTPWHTNIASKTRVVFVEPCAVRPFIFAEISAMRQVFKRTATIIIAEYSRGRETCDRSKKSATQIGGRSLENIRNNSSNSVAGATPTSSVGAVLHDVPKWTEGGVDDFYHETHPFGPPQVRSCDYPCADGMIWGEEVWGDVIDTRPANRFDLIVRDGDEGGVSCAGDSCVVWNGQGVRLGHADVVLTFQNVKSKSTTNKNKNRHEQKEMDAVDDEDHRSSSPRELVVHSWRAD